jgi:hypothetical protein
MSLFVQLGSSESRSRGQSISRIFPDKRPIGPNRSSGISVFFRLLSNLEKLGGVTTQFLFTWWDIFCFFPGSKDDRGVGSKKCTAGEQKKQRETSEPHRDLQGN